MKRPCNALTLLLATLAATLLVLGSMASPTHAYWCPLAEELRVAGLDAACEHGRLTSDPEASRAEDACPLDTATADNSNVEREQDPHSDLGAYRYNSETGVYEYEAEYRFEEAYGYDDYSYEDDYGYGYTDESSDAADTAERDELTYEDEYPYEDEYAYEYEYGEYRDQQAATPAQPAASPSYAEMYDYDFGPAPAETPAEPVASTPVVTAAEAVEPAEAYGYEYGYDEFGVPYGYDDYDADYDYASDDAEDSYEAEQARDLTAEVVEMTEEAEVVEMVEVAKAVDPAADMLPAARPEQPELPEFAEQKRVSPPQAYDYYRQPYEDYQDDINEFGAVYGVEEADEPAEEVAMDEESLMTGYDPDYDLAVYQATLAAQREEKLNGQQELADARINYDWNDADLLAESASSATNSATADNDTVSVLSQPETLGDTSGICHSVECPATFSGGDDQQAPAASPLIEKLRTRSAVRPGDRNLLRGCRVDDLTVDSQVAARDAIPCPPVPPALPCELSDDDLADELAACNDPLRGELLRSVAGPQAPAGYFSHQRLIEGSLTALDKLDAALGQTYLRLVELAGVEFEALARLPESNERR